MQEGNKSSSMLKIVQFGRGIFTLSPVAYITVDFKKLVIHQSDFTLQILS